MTRLFLAIPARTFLFVSFLLFPSSAQTNPDSSQVEPTGTVSGAQAQKLSDEDMARLYLVRKQYHEAQDLFYKLTQEQPKNAVYWNELGISFHNQIELGAALKCYQKSAKLDPKYADVIVQRWQDQTGQSARLKQSGRNFSEMASKKMAAA